MMITKNNLSNLGTIYEVATHLDESLPSETASTQASSTCGFEGKRKLG